MAGSDATACGSLTGAAPGRERRAGRGRSRTAETRHSCSRSVRPPSTTGHHAAPFRVRLIPIGTVEAANPTSWARSSRSGANPARRTAGVQAAAELGDPHRLGNGDRHHGVRAGERAAPGQLGVEPAGLALRVPLGSSGLAAELVVDPLGQVGGPLRVAGLPVRLGLRHDRVGDQERPPLAGLARSQDRSQRPHHRAPVRELDGGADRVPRVVAVVPHGGVRARGPGHRPGHVGVDPGVGRALCQRLDDPGPVPGGEPGTARHRELGASQPPHRRHPQRAHQVGLDLTHEQVDLPAAALQAATGLLRGPGDPGLRHHDRHERLGAHRRLGEAVGQVGVDLLGQRRALPADGDWRPTAHARRRPRGRCGSG